MIDLGRGCILDSVVVHTAWFPPAGVLPPSLMVAVSDVLDGGFEAAGYLPAPVRQMDPRGANTRDTGSRAPERVALPLPLRGERGRYVLIALQHSGKYVFTDEVDVHGFDAPASASRAAISVRPTTSADQSPGPG